MQDISWIDTITIALILLLALRGAFNGFVKEFFGLLGLIGGIFLASKYAKDAGVWLDANIFSLHNDASLFPIGFVSVLASFWILCIIVGVIVSKLLSLSGLGWLNRIIGFFVGGAKIFLIFSVLFVTISNIQFVQLKLQKYLNNSFMYPIYIKTGAYIVTINPEYVQKITNKNINTNIFTNDDNITNKNEE